MNELGHDVQATETARQVPTANEKSEAIEVERPAETTSELVGPRLVNVAEAIRYRKRAQAAEQELAELRTRLDEAQRQSEEIQQRLSDVERRSAIDARLGEVGVVDMEAARLLVEANLNEAGGSDVSEAIDEVRRQRPQLFRTMTPCTATAMGPAVMSVEQDVRDIDRAALAARRSGHNADVMHYMNLRRSASR